MNLPFYLPAALFPKRSWWRAALAQDAVETGIVCSGAVRHSPDARRYTICTANGLQTLSVPVSGGSKSKQRLSAAAVDYNHDWQHHHWGTLFSANGRAPYFEHYAAPLKALLDADYSSLPALNLASIKWLASEMRIAKSFVLVDDGATESKGNVPPLFTAELPRYQQVFEGRWGFQDDLSAIDLLMAKGPYAAAFLVG